MDSVSFDFCDQVVSHLTFSRRFNSTSDLWNFVFKEHLEKRQYFKIMIAISKNCAKWKYVMTKLGNQFFSDDVRPPFNRRFWRVYRIELCRVKSRDEFHNVKSLSTFIRFLQTSLSHAPSFLCNNSEMPQCALRLLDALASVRNFKDVSVCYFGQILDPFFDRQLRSANLTSLEMRGTWPEAEGSGMKTKVAQLVLTSRCLNKLVCRFEFDFEFFKTLVGQSKNEEIELPPRRKRKIVFRSVFSKSDLTNYEKEHLIENYCMPDAIRGEEKQVLEWRFVGKKHNNYCDLAFTGDFAIVEQYRYPIASGFK